MIRRSSHRPIVLYWRLSDFWSLRGCGFATHRCHALLNTQQLLSTPKNEYLTGKQLQIMLTCKMSSNMNHSKLQIWDKNCWAMDVATHIAIYCGKQQRCFFCRKCANIQWKMISSIFLLVVKDWNRQHHGQTTDYSIVRNKRRPYVY